MVYKNQECKQS